MSHPSSAENRFRRLYDLPMRGEGDDRPVIVFDDPETRKRTDLTQDERRAVKHASFLRAYGARPTFPDIDELRDLSRRDAQSSVDRFWATYGGEGAEPLRAAMEKLGPAAVLDTLVEEFPEPRVVEVGGDYSAVEERVLAHMLSTRDKLNDTAQALAQATESAAQMTKATGRLMEILQSFEKTHGVKIEVMGENVTVAIPESLSHDEKTALLEQIQTAVTEVRGPDLPKPPFSMGCSTDDADQRMRRVAQVGRHGGMRHLGLMAALSMLATGNGLPDGLGSVLAPPPLPPPPPVNRKSGEVGRISPDLAWKLKAKGHAVEPGDMLVWHVEGFDGSQWTGIFARRENGQIKGNPIPLEHLPHKVQKRALAAKPELA